jgi:3',5'-cyclic AMP phosphodiesterase CpdA
MASIDKFPFETESAEQLFAKMFVHPHNGPKSEDGSKYDPDPGKTDFPSYDENVYYYTYGNMAMVVLNSNYLYAPSEDMVHLTGGNIHGYIMDNQLEWFGNTIAKLEKDDNIDHIFVTIHTPAFPNGGHANNDMWYFGNNEIRPYIAGKPVDKGIIERRDEFLDIMVNKSQKVIALLCGDEHNYSRLRIDGTTDIYPENWEGSKLKLRRTIWQITNGSAGAPYYAQEKLPWSGSVEIFSTKYALVFLNIDGKNIDVEVINPDTGEEVDKAKIR